MGVADVRKATSIGRGTILDHSPCEALGNNGSTLHEEFWKWSPRERGGT